MRDHVFRLTTVLALVIACEGYAQDAKSDQRGFSTPEAAVDAFVAACKANSSAELIAIFGPLLAAELEHIDATEEQTNHTRLVAQAKKVRRIEERSDKERVLLLGYELWPFPMPIVFDGSTWKFDTAAGLDELLKRRVGRNELSAIAACRAYVDAQIEYAKVDRDGDNVLEYAQRLLSTPGQRDGLYWKADSDSKEAMSPLGPFLAAADAVLGSGKPEGYMGYRFKVLTSQSKHAPGGKIAYLDAQNMTGGFALVAWPIEYGHSGVMTFIVSHSGAVYEKDLGPKTEREATRLSRFDPDSTWKLVKE